MHAIDLAEQGLVPDWGIRWGIRRLLSKTLSQEASDPGVQRSRVEGFADELRQSPIALETQAANDQHYEVPADFFRVVLGPRLKYSCCLWDDSATSLSAAEEAMLRLTCERAQLQDGMKVLDLGCGWGSLGLWIAERYPRCQVVALSNSNGQREFITNQAAERGLRNITTITANVCDFQTSDQFDRVMSIEMFEHLRNYEEMLARISGWLTSSGKLFVHIFCHRTMAYPYQTDGAENWMGRHFFTGGIMPADDLLLHFQRDLKLDQRWQIPGLHYARTCEAWLKNLDRHRSDMIDLFAEHTNRRQAQLQFRRWRIFFMACAELFAYQGGKEWMVSHYRFTR